MDKKIVEKGYTKKFYDDIALNNRTSANIIVPIILEKVKSVCLNDKVTVCDLGCGTGQWLAEYANNGCEIHGVDADRVNISQLSIDEDKFEVHDLKKVYKPSKKYTIASCLEVAEHLEEQYANTIVKSLTNSSDIIVFSAAIPYQRGVHHVNCQWPTYWIKKFNDRGYCEIDCIRNLIWDNEKVQPYYASNIFIYVKKDIMTPALRELQKNNNPHMYNLVNPRMWNGIFESKIMKFIYWLYYKHNYVYKIYDKMFNRDK